jgi:hypothetical protein
MKISRAVTTLSIIALLLAAITVIAASSKTEVLPALNGITLPEGYKDWRIISASHRTDNNTLRIILGNDTAVAAARKGDVKPWPDGSILAKLSWKDSTHEKWPAATIPGKFVQAEFMIKDAKRFAATGGWGFARWLGLEQQPYGKDANFVQECFGCHTPVKDNDYVYTYPAILP